MHISIVLLVCCTFSANGAGKKVGEMEERLRSLENSLTRTKDELNSCYKQLDDKPASFVGQAWSSFGSCLTGSPDKSFKPFVGEVLRILDLHEDHSQILEHNRELAFTATIQDLQTLKRFILYDDVKFIEVQEILLGGLRRRERREGWLSLEALPLVGGNKVHPSIALFAIASLVCCVVLVPLLLGARKRLILFAVACYCIVHTWLGEYWKAVAKKESILAKHGPNMINCRLEKRGYVGSVSAWLSGLFNGQEDPCEEYYRAAMVDPAFEVNLVHALVESLSQLMGVLGGLGKAMGHFVTNFLAPLPLVFKVPALLVGGVLLVLLVLILSGYQFSTLFFSIGPSKNSTKPAKKLLNKSKRALKSGVQETETDTDMSDVETRHRNQKKLKADSKKAAALPYPAPPLPYPRDNHLMDLVNQHPDNRPQYQS